MFKKILVPMDLSECSQKALRAAVDLASIYGGEVFLLHVIDKPTGQYHDKEDVDDELNAIQTDESDLMNDALKFAADAKESGKPELTRDRIFIRIASGAPAAEIVKAANESQTEMIVMGTHGRTSIKEMFLGSTAERVAREASCAVLVVKPDGYPYLRD